MMNVISYTCHPSESGTTSLSCIVLFTILTLCICLFACLSVRLSACLSVSVGGGGGCICACMCECVSVCLSVFHYWHSLKCDCSAMFDGIDMYMLVGLSSPTFSALFGCSVHLIWDCPGNTNDHHVVMPWSPAKVKNLEVRK